MTSGHFCAPTQLTEGHDLAGFDCGILSLDDWLKNRAMSNQRCGASRTYVLYQGNEAVGYYCLATGAIDRDEAPGAIRRNIPDPIPVVVLGRLAVDRRFQNQRLGSAMLRDAVCRFVQVAEIAGAVALLVHPISENARGFYQSWGFRESSLEPMTLCLMLGTVHRTGITSGQK